MTTGQIGCRMILTTGQIYREDEVVIKNIVSGLLLLLCVVTLLTLIIQVLTAAVNTLRKTPVNTVSLHKTTVITLASLLMTAVFGWYTKLSAHTPPIVDAMGQEIPNSIAQMRQVELNGRRQWITLRGYREDLPILLFLAGGPGGSQTAAVRRNLSELEKHFLVVNWDQPGSAKSYYAVPAEGLTPDVYIQDGIALSNWLCETYHQDRIWLMGESWGSALGIMMAYKKPNLFYAFLGTGQMVDFLETEKIDYRLALSEAEKNGNLKLVEKLTKNGPPPYLTPHDVTWKSLDYLNYLGSVMSNNPEIHAGGDMVGDLLSEEYGMLDKLNYIRGLTVNFGRVYIQLYGIDLRETCPTLEIPVYFLLGRHDINAPLALAQDYFDRLEAPQKEIRWFERSGHNPWLTETDLFVMAVLDITGK